MRTITTEVDRAVPHSIASLGTAIYGTDQPTESQLWAVRRAVRRLEHLGVIRVDLTAKRFRPGEFGRPVPIPELRVSRLQAAHWHMSHRADPRALPLADRHYNRQKPGTPQFVPPGSCLVLLTAPADALWVTSAPIARYVQHAWAGAWTCTLFRNESDHRASDLIIEAVAATVWYFTVYRQKPVPKQGLITFVDAAKIRPRNGRRHVPGYSYVKAGWTPVGQTQGGLYALQLRPEDMPAPQQPRPPLRG
jgi:hypothetical protein